MSRALAILSPALLAVLVRLATGPHPVDDAYITFRYARNLAEGIGLVYNPGEAVLGTTTPFWATLLSVFYRVGATDLPAVASSLAAMFDGLNAGLVALLAMRMGYRWQGAALVGAAWALNPLSVAYATGGMETSLFVLIVLSVLTLVSAGRFTLAGAAAGAAIFVRPEAVLLAATVSGLAWRRGWRLAFWPLAASAVPTAAWVFLLLAWYGSPLPQTVLAKQVAYTPGAPWMSLVVIALHAGLPGWSFPALPMLVAFPLALMCAATLGFAACVALPRLRARQVPWAPFLVFLGLYTAFHVVAGFRGARIFPWYLVPLIPLYLLAASAGLLAVIRLPHAWLGAALVIWQLLAIDWGRPFLPAGFDLRREALYLQVGRELAQELPRGAVIAAPEIGALGYQSDLRILDTVGLVTPEASRHYPLPPDQVEGDNAIPPRLILEAGPDAVVTLDQFARRSLLPNAEFQQRYRLDRTYPLPIWLSHELLVFRRVDETGGEL